MPGPVILAVVFGLGLAVGRGAAREVRKRALLHLRIAPADEVRIIGIDLFVRAIERFQDEIVHHIAHIGHPTPRRDHPQIALRGRGIVGEYFRDLGRVGHGSMLRVGKGTEAGMTFGAL